MEQLKRKEVKKEEIVCSYMNTETGVIDYSIREGIVSELIHENKKYYIVNDKIFKFIILLSFTNQYYT